MASCSVGQDCPPREGSRIHSLGEGSSPTTFGELSDYKESKK